MPPPNYENFPSASFKTALSTASFKLKQLGNGAIAGREYERMKKRLGDYADAYQNPNPFIFENIRQTRLALAVLIQERNDNDILKVLIEKQRFNTVLTSVLNFVNHLAQPQNKRASESISKSLLLLYYQRYFSFERGVVADDVHRALVEPLQMSVKQYTGRNRMVLAAKNCPELLAGDLSVVLVHFKDARLQEIQQNLCLGTDFEIFQRLRLLRLLARVQALQANQYDEGVKKLFGEIKQHKDVLASQVRSISEEAVHQMVELCRADGQICTEWQNFIFDVVGDPRAQKNHHAWHRVGDEQRQWFVGVLSRGDLREFLETMTDGQGDEIYQYRKQFWLQYVDYAVNAKIMLGNNAYGKLRFQNPEMWQRFNSSPETYSRLEEADRSCVFIDFGNFKVIEGTHSARCRFYNGLPIKLSDSYYNYDEFYNYPQAQDVLTDKFNHTSSETYAWQNRIRIKLNTLLNIRVNLREVTLDEVRNSDFLFNRVRNHLLQNFYNHPNGHHPDH